MYGLRLEALREQFRVFPDRSSSAVPVGFLYHERYHTLVVAPATSNTVAKCALGISDTLPTNMFAQGRQQQLDAGETVIEILAERAFTHHLREVAVARADQLEVHGARLVRA